MPGENDSRPTVTIGLPVFNGERHLAAAIDSILGQTFTDFELIISDNASTDRTAEICQDYAARDARIRYSRNGRNIGAGPNFNRVFELARGRFFKWAAHDDVLEPEFLECCVAALEGAPDAVLCHTAVREIDEHGEDRPYGHRPMQEMDADRPSQRFGSAVLGAYSCTEIFGLIRRDALGRIPLHRGCLGTDRIILAELALHGRFVHVPGKLFAHRDHSGRFVHVALTDRAARIAWYDPSQAGGEKRHAWSLYRGFFGAVRRSAPNRREGLACLLHLLRWPTVKMNYVLLLSDRHYYTLDPRLRRTLSMLKRRVLGARTPRVDPPR